jgi:hypothetical protein
MQRKTRPRIALCERRKLKLPRLFPEPVIAPKQLRNLLQRVIDYFI